MWHCRQWQKKSILPFERAVVWGMPVSKEANERENFGNAARKDIEGHTTLLGFARLLCRAPNAHAQSYPSRSITVVVPFPAGGPSDVVARIVMTIWAERWAISW